MKRALVYSMMCGMGLIFVAGCGEEAKTTEKKTVTTPEGKTSTTDEHKVEKSGKNPPATP